MCFLTDSNVQLCTSKCDYFVLNLDDATEAIVVVTVVKFVDVNVLCLLGRHDVAINQQFVRALISANIAVSHITAVT